MITLNEKSPHTVSLDIANKVKQRRLEKNLTQKGIAERATVSLATYRRFERTGEVSLQNLLLIALVLGSLEDFELLFARRVYSTLDDVLDEGKTKRKRGKTN